MQRLQCDRCTMLTVVCLVTRLAYLAAGCWSVIVLMDVIGRMVTLGFLYNPLLAGGWVLTWLGASLWFGPVALTWPRAEMPDDQVSRRSAMSKRLQHDTAWATATAILECIGAAISPMEHRAAFDAIYQRVRVALETYELHVERERGRLQPGRN